MFLVPLVELGVPRLGLLGLKRTYSILGSKKVPLVGLGSFWMLKKIKKPGLRPGIDEKKFLSGQWFWDYLLKARRTSYEVFFMENCLLYMLKYYLI